MPFYGGVVGISKVFTPDSFDAASKKIHGLSVIQSDVKKESGTA
jgi:hypothetical protein